MRRSPALTLVLALTLAGETPRLAGGWLYTVNETGIAVLHGTETVFFPGAVSLGPWCGETLLVLCLGTPGQASTEMAVAAPDGTILSEGLSDAYIFSDEALGGEAWAVFGPEGGMTVYDADGAVRVTGALAGRRSTAGLFACADGVSSGYKDTDNQWVFRYPLDSEA